MKKKIIQLSVLMALAGAASAQIADNFILPKHSTMTASDHVGQALSKFDNYVLVGNPDDDINSTCAGRNQMSGSALLYKDGKVIRVYKGNFFDTTPEGDQFGWRVGQSVAIGAEWLAIGASSANYGTGKVFLVKKDNTGEFASTFTVTLNPPANDHNININGSEFGEYISIGRTTLVVSAPRGSYKGVNSSLVFIYKLVNGTWTLVKTIANTSGNSVKGTVALSDDEKKIIIGTGSSIVFYHNTTGNEWIFTKSISADGLGSATSGAVDISNDRAVFTKEGSVEILRLDAVNGWVTDQVLTTSSTYDVAIEGTKMVLGQPFHEGTNGGRVVHLERSGSASAPWVIKSTVGVSQPGAFTGFTVDLANNVVAAGLFGYDYPDLVDPCFNNRADEHAGGTLLYNFDFFNGKFFNGLKSFREESETLGGAVESVAQKVLVSPNPAESNFVNISTNETLLGVVAISSTGAAKQIGLTNNTADISELEPGMYILQIKTENGTTTQKLVVK